MNLRKKFGKIIEKKTVENLKIEISKNISGKIILDNGCGGGSFYYFNHADKKIYGIDIRTPINFFGKFKLADSTKIPFSDDKFDCVVFAGVIQYIEDYDKSLKEIKRVLKKGGKLIISSVNSKSLLRRVGVIDPKPKSEAGELQILSFGELANILQNTGFIVKKKSGVDCLKIPRVLASNSLFICENDK